MLLPLENALNDIRIIPGTMPRSPETHEYQCAQYPLVVREVVLALECRSTCGAQRDPRRGKSVECGVCER